MLGLPAVRGTEADLTPYCIHLPSNNRCYWSVKAHWRPRSHVTTSGQSNLLQSYLCSASQVSLQPSLRWFTRVSGQLGQPCICKGAQLHDKGVVTIATGCSFPMVTPMCWTWAWITLSATLQSCCKAISSRASRTMTTLTVYTIVLMITW